MPLPISTTRRTAATAASALALAAAVLSAPPAAAAPYEITTCGASGSVGDWRPFGTPASAGQLDVGDDCPPRSPAAGEDPNWSPHRTGLYATDTRRTDVDTPAGATAGWQLEAPAGARITRAQLWRAVRKQDDRGWRAFWRSSDGPDLDDCTIAIGTTACGEGGWSWLAGSPAVSSYVDRAGLDTTSVSFGLRCAAAAGERCLNGYGLHTARFLLYEARLTLDDPTSPNGVTAAGEGWTSTAWNSGTVPISVSGSDTQSGIRATRVYVDGVAVSTIDRSNTTACDWSRTTPCGSANAIAHTIRTPDLEDGLHAVDVAAVNAAGTVTRASRSAPLQVDNTPPAAPTGLTVTRRGTTNAFDIAWSAPADSGSPISTRYQLCMPACEPVTETSATQLDGVTLNGAASGSIRLWHVDEAGHEDTSAAATLALTYQAPPPVTRDPDPPIGDPDPEQPPVPDPGPGPGPGGVEQPPAPPGHGQPAPTLPAGDRAAAQLRLSRVVATRAQLRVSGRISRRATGRVRVTFEARRRGGIVRVTRAASLRSGRWSLSLTLPRALRATRGTLRAVYAGDRATAPATVLRRAVASAPARR